MNIDFGVLLNIYLVGVESVLKVELIVLLVLGGISLASALDQIRRWGSVYKGREPSEYRGLIFCAVVAGICLLWPLEAIALILAIIGSFILYIDSLRAHPRYQPSYYGF